MNAIVVPTDFSVAAEGALLYAATLAQRFSTTLHLVHAYQIPVSMNDMPVLMVSAEELKEQADAGLARSRDLVLRSFPQLEVHTESLLGDLNDELQDLYKQDPPILIVMGRSGASGVEKVLFGSTTVSIVRKSKVPVLVVPEGVQPTPVKQAALATDLSLTEGFPFGRITDIVRKLEAKLHIIHVCSPKSEPVSTEPVKSHFEELQPECHVIHDENFVHGIQEYTRQHAIDLLIIVPHHHSFLERLLFRTHTVELVEKLTLPVLCINEQ